MTTRAPSRLPSRRGAGAPAASAGLFARCPRCGTAVLRTAAGVLLEVEAHPLAVTLPDGRTASPRQAADAAMGRTAPIGHHRHVTAPGYGCLPPVQLELFGAGVKP
ncbi:hypothetical protein OG693_39885 [Streptomyces sp. NBC_01259]|uniref:hypothetical protein n=1 Tax=Streptomyces sp. NBC_01259 TaxID=2903800 RepID=UPI00324928F0